MKLEDLFEYSETWKQIPGFPAYEVSKRGQIRVAATKKKLSQQPHYGNDKRSPYMRVVLVGERGRKNVRVSRIVAFAFLGEPSEPNMEVDHKDNNTKNNSVDNLQWLTPEENQKKRLDRLK